MYVSRTMNPIFHYEPNVRARDAHLIRLSVHYRHFHALLMPSNVWELICVGCYC